MTTDRPAIDEFALSDAAYVLGALSAGDRGEYETHLEGCADCARSVAGLAGMPALMSSVSLEQLTEEHTHLAAEVPFTSALPFTTEPHFTTELPFTTELLVTTETEPLTTGFALAEGAGALPSSMLPSLARAVRRERVRRQLSVGAAAAGQHHPAASSPSAATLEQERSQSPTSSSASPTTSSTSSASSTTSTSSKSAPSATAPAADPVLIRIKAFKFFV